MNPFQAWYLNSRTLRNKMDEYYSQSMEFVPEGKLKNDMKRMFTESKIAMDKCLVINALSIFKQYGAARKI